MSTPPPVRKNKTKKKKKQKNAGATSIVQVEATNQDDILDTEELNQILIKIRQHCYTHRGVDPGQLFDRWDKDKDGTLDYDEMRLLMYKVQSTSEHEFEQLFAFIDKDGDDVISREEFCEFVHTKPEKGAHLKEDDTTTGMNHPDKQRQHFFKGLQKKSRVSVVGKRWNSDDTLDADELQMVHRKIRAASYTSKGVDIPALFSEWDIDNDGTLTRDEFYVAIKKLVPGITRPEFDQLCCLIDLEDTGGIDVVMVQNFVDKHSQSWERKRVKRGEEEDTPCNDAVANTKFFGGLRPANNTSASTQLKQHGRNKITAAEMHRLRTKVCAESYTTGGMDLRRVYDRLVPSDFKCDMKATCKFLRLCLPTLMCMDEVHYILSEWGLNRQNDGSLRFKDFQKWGKTKAIKKSVYRKTTFEPKKKHLGKDGIPITSRFSGHTMGKRYIQDDPMFNDLVPQDLFQNLNQSYQRKSTKSEVEKAAAEVGIDMNELPEAAEYDDEDEDDEEDYYSDGKDYYSDDNTYQQSDASGDGDFMTAKDRRTREMLDIGTWSDSDDEGPAEEEKIATVDRSGPQGEINTLLGARKFGGGRFRMPDMPDISLAGQVNFSMGGGTGADLREAAAVDYYWNQNIQEGKIREVEKKIEGEGEEEEGEGNSSSSRAPPSSSNPVPLFGLININVVSAPDPEHTGNMHLSGENAQHQYGLFGKTARKGGTHLEDLIDPGTWNFTPGKALGNHHHASNNEYQNNNDNDPDDMYGGLPMKDPRGNDAISIFDQQQQRVEQFNNTVPSLDSHTMINRSPRPKQTVHVHQRSTQPADFERLSRPKEVMTPTKPSNMSPGKRRLSNDHRKVSSPRVAYFPVESSGDEYSAPPSPRSDRSISSARAQKEKQRTRSKSTARWDPKKKKFVQNVSKS